MFSIKETSTDDKFKLDSAICVLTTRVMKNYEFNTFNMHCFLKKKPFVNKTVCQQTRFIVTKLQSHKFIVFIYKRLNY